MVLNKCRQCNMEPPFAARIQLKGYVLGTRHHGTLGFKDVQSQPRPSDLSLTEEPGKHISHVRGALRRQTQGAVSFYMKVRGSLGESDR